MNAYAVEARRQLIGVFGIVERNVYLTKRYFLWDLAFMVWTIANTLTIVFIARAANLPPAKENTLAMVRENLNPEVDIEGILPTLVDTRTLHAKEAIELLEENFGDRVFASRITKTVRFAEAPVKGMSVLKYDPDGKAAYAYRALAKEVLGNGKRR